MSYAAKRLLLLGNKNSVNGAPRVAAYQERVVADGGTFEGFACMSTVIKKLLTISV